MYQIILCPTHKKALVFFKETETHTLFKCPVCNYVDYPGAAHHDLPEKYIKLQAEIERLKQIIKSQGEECEHRHNILCQVKEIIDAYFVEPFAEEEQ